MHEKVIVLLSAYKGVKYISQQLDSIIEQTGVEVHIIARDDGSPDDGATLRILREYEKEYPSLITIKEEENVGFAKSFSKLITAGLRQFPNAKYFAFADQDDIWLSDKLATGIKTLIHYDSKIPVTYCCNTQLVDENLNKLGLGWKSGTTVLTKERALVQSFATGCTMVFNRRAAELYERYCPAVIKVHDFLIYQICMFLGRVFFDETPHILYRQHSSNQIGRPDLIGRMKKRLQGHFKDHTLECQNRRFLESFKDLLSESDRKLLSDFVNYRTSIRLRLKLLFNKKITYSNSFERNFYLKLKILLGKV